jgi:hypothetical protein
LFAGQLYKNNMSSSPFWGTPVYFYLLFLTIKVPLLIVLSMVLGILISIRRWRHVGHAFLLFMFLFFIVPYSLIGGKWLRYTLALMPFVYMLSAVGTIAIIEVLSSMFAKWKNARVVIFAGVAILFIGFPAWTAVANGPHYALYNNALASNKAGYYFPHDEFYDDGLREAIKYVCDTAPNGATIAHETPGVARYYLSRYGRTDLNSQAISSEQFDARMSTGSTYVIVQRGRTYFENVVELEFVRANYRKVNEVYIGGALAAEVFVKQ